MTNREMAPEPTQENPLFVGPPEDPDRYQLLKIAGRGGESVLYRAVERLNDAVLAKAVKMLHPHHEPELDEWAERWLEQARLLSHIQHPAIVTAHAPFKAAPPHRRGEGTSAPPRSICRWCGWRASTSGSWFAASRSLLADLTP